MKSSAVVIKELKAGNARFCRGQSLHSPLVSLEKMQTGAQKGQVPKAIVLCCSDSRAPVEIVLDQDVGDLFVIRVAGNIVDPSLIGSIEFAVDTFGTTTILVLGHTQCGAIRATLDHIANKRIEASDNIHDLISRIRPHVWTIAHQRGLTRHQKIDRAVHANVNASVWQLSHSSPLIKKLVVKHKLKIFGAILDLSTGKVHFDKL
jgi:carbonic anhydrase